MPSLNDLSVLRELPIENPIDADDGIVEERDPLESGIKEDELIKVINKRILDSKKFFNKKYNLTERRKKNELYYFGRQIQQKEQQNELKTYESRYLDNAIYEIEQSIVTLALSRRPEMIVIPGADKQEQKESSKDLTKCINTDLKAESISRVAELTFRHRPVYFLGVAKTRWNPEIDDYCFEAVHPDSIVIDHTCTSSNVDDMSFIAQALPLTIQEVIMRFPGKKEQFLDEVKKQGVTVGDPESWRNMATQIKIWEVWYTWYKKEGSDNLVSPTEAKAEPESKWERIEGVLWKFEDLILKNIKNPNFDYEGKQQLFTYDDISDESTKRPIGEEEVIGALASGVMPDITTEQVYFNYFDQPKKPFHLVVYDQWGKIALDETSRIEQNLRNQENQDRIGKQIMETLNQRGKHIWSKEGGLKPEDLEQIDMNDPDQDAMIDGNVNANHKFIPPERPDAAQFNALGTQRARMFELAGANNLTGALQSDVATNNQIGREANYTRTDFEVERTINSLYSWMAQWIMQWIKLRYTKDHFRKVLGNKGDILFMKLKRDMIDDGMEVTIKASGTDKLRVQKNAMDMAKLGAPFINPIDFFNDMDIDDPEGRAERGMMFATDPQSYIAKYILKLDNTNQLAGAIAPETQMQGDQLAQGATAQVPNPMAPVTPTPDNTQAVPVEPAIAAPEGSPRNL